MAVGLYNTELFYMEADFFATWAIASQPVINHENVM